MKKIFAIALGVLALASCSREAAPVKDGSSREVKFTTNVRTFTLKSTAIDGETVKVFAGAPINVTKEATVVDDGLSFTDKIYWNEDQTEKTSFGAIYPSMEINAQSEYSVANGDYAWHSKVLVAGAPDVTPGSTVALTFKHPFSNIVVKVTNSLAGSPEISSVALAGVKANGTIDAYAGVASADESTATVTATAKEGAALTWQAIVYPGVARPVLKVTAGGTTYNFVLAADFTFEANKSYTAEVELKDAVTPVPSGEEVVFSLTVNDWEEVAESLGYTASDSEVEEEADWYIIGNVYDDDPEVPAWSENVVFKLDKTSATVYTITINVGEGLEFLFRTYKPSTPASERWNSTLGMWKSDSNETIGEWYGLATDSDGKKNIKVSEAGNYTFTIDFGNTEQANQLHTVKN